MTKKSFALNSLLIVCCYKTSIALAVPPPDFIVNSVSQIGYIISIIGAFSSTAIALFWQRLSIIFNTPLKQKILWIFFLFGFALIIYGFLDW